jgi:hypothetical protein
LTESQLLQFRGVCDLSVRERKRERRRERGREGERERGRGGGRGREREGGEREERKLSHLQSKVANSLLLDPTYLTDYQRITHFSGPPVSIRTFTIIFEHSCTAEAIH